MAILTKTQLRDAIKREARIQTTNDLDVMIYDIMDGVVTDIFTKERCYELRVINAPITMTAATPTVTLPNDFMHVDEVFFSVDSGTTQLRLWPKNDFSYVQPTGTPKWWLLQGANLFVFPYSLVTTSHKIYLNYFKFPTFVADSDNFPVLRLQEGFKKLCVTRVLEYHNSLEQAARMLTGADTSMTSGKAANLEGRERDSIDTRQPGFGTVPADTK